MSLYDKINEEVVKDHFLNEMAYQIGVTESGFLIYVNSDDAGNIPHFHYVDNTSRGKDKGGTHTCIKIEKAEYFHHEGKRDYLNYKQRKELDKFMRQPFKVSKYNVTNWEFIVDTWNMNNSKMNVSKDAVMPNYRELK